MKKLFTIVAATLFAFAANAAVINITPDSPRENDNIRYAVRDNVQAGDTVVVADGTYAESSSIELNKDVVIMAAEGATPIVQLASGAYLKLMNAGNVQLIGLKFDGATNSTQYAIRPYDNSKSSVIVEGCEFYGFTKNIITGDGTNHTDSVIINNCYFHDNTRSAVYFAASTDTEGSHLCDYLEVTNTTIANTSALSGAAVIDIRSNGSAEGEYNELYVDHVTIYGVAGYDRAIQSYKSTRVTIKNSIIVEPSDNANYLYPTYCYGGAVSNILTFNTKNHRSGPTITGLIENTDPLFVDAASGDYTLGEGSPALGAGTDGKNLGDPRWWPVATYTITLVQPAEGGTIAASATEDIEEGTEITLTATPAEGYELESWTITDADDIALDLAISNEGKFNMPAENIKVTADFKLSVQNLTVAEAAAIVNALADNATQDGNYVVTGYVTKVDYTWTSNNGATFWIDDQTKENGGATNLLQIFKGTAEDEASQAVKVGDKVVVTGTQFQKYIKSGNAIPEMVKPSYKVTEVAPAFEPEGEGTEEKPYTVADVIGLNGADANEAWVVGYVMGAWAQDKTFDNTLVANIVLADAADETDIEKMTPVQLPSNTDVRTNLNVVDNTIIGAQVMVKGMLQAYFTVPGVKSTSDYKILKAVPTSLENAEISGKAVKVLRNGQVVILRDGKRYNVIGLELK